MNLALKTKTIGLFGTCGGSRWREPFIAAYDAHGIASFNPQVDNWTPELADVEAWHLANDQLILFPITSETFAFGSLAETGFSVQSALSLNANRFVVLYIEPDVSESLKAQSPEQADASRRARKLAMAHLAKVTNPNVFVATSLPDMLKKSLQLYAVLEMLEAVRETNPDWRSTMTPESWLKIIHNASEVALA